MSFQVYDKTLGIVACVNLRFKSCVLKALTTKLKIDILLKLLITLQENLIQIKLAGTVNVIEL